MKPKDNPHECSKAPFTKQEAQTRLNELINSGKWSQKEGNGRIYHCAKCNAWHLTHQPLVRGKSKKGFYKLKFSASFEKYLPKDLD